MRTRVLLAAWVVVLALAMLAIAPREAPAQSAPAGSPASALFPLVPNRWDMLPDCTYEIPATPTPGGPPTPTVGPLLPGQPAACRAYPSSTHVATDPRRARPPG